MPLLALCERGALMEQPILEVKGVKTHFPIKSGIFNKTTGYVKAVDGVDFKVFPGETLGIVGESGCGKSTVSRTVMRLLEPSAGEIWFNGKNLAQISKEEMRRTRKDIQLVFQDPYASLNPRKTIKQILIEPLMVHGIGASGQERLRMVEEIIEIVGLRKEHLDRHPHNFSGGQRQRIGIARALILKPKVIIADEPVSALDVSVQAQVVNLLQDLQKEFGLTYLFISHGLAVVEHISTRVAVMYLGRIVEVADAKELYLNPLHPYTQALLSAIPVPDPKEQRDRIILKGDVPTSRNPPSGCRFRTRCPIAIDECARIDPELREVSPEHTVACIRVEGYDSARSLEPRPSHAGVVGRP
jgi:oligopeptide/dipeptide ABC transporter ATP-binding protein